MAWNLQEVERRVYPRNPIRAVICQLRFDPILKIADRIADFQDAVRRDFPRFDRVTSQTFELNPLEGPRLRKSDEFRFTRTENDAVVVLGQGALALESQTHRDRDQFFGWFEQALRALEQVFAPISGTRLGLRYVNVVDREVIMRGLAREVDWVELVAPAFFTIPQPHVSLPDSLFVSEVTAAREPGAMTLRCGLLKDPDGQRRYRFDVDRYEEASLTVHVVRGRLAQFADDIFYLFESAAGPGLKQWMERPDA